MAQKLEVLGLSPVVIHDLRGVACNWSFTPCPCTQREVRVFGSFVIKKEKEKEYISIS